MSNTAGSDPPPVIADTLTAQGPGTPPSGDQNAEVPGPHITPDAPPTNEIGTEAHDDPAKPLIAATDTPAPAKEPEPEAKEAAPVHPATIGAQPTDEEPAPVARGPMREVPSAIGDEDDLWKAANDLAKSLIETQIKSMDGTLDTMLIFAGLFSAVNITVTSTSLPQLSSPDYSLEMVQLLRNVVTGNATLPNATSTALPSNALRDNILFTASLLFSLFAAFAAVLGKQWLINYVAVKPGLNEKDESGQRRNKIAGAETWELRLVVESLLPLLLQISLALFIVGLVDSFWIANRWLGICNAVLVSIAFFLFAATIVVAFVWPGCPFQSPVSTILHSLHRHLPALASKLRHWRPDFAWWRRILPATSHISLVPENYEAQDTTAETSASDTIEEVISQAIEFTFKHTDDPVKALPAALTIPSLTSQAITNKIGRRVGPLLLSFWRSCILQLGREAQSGFQGRTLDSATLFTRAILHFYVSGSPGIDWESWWSEVDTSFRPLKLNDTELWFLSPNGLSDQLERSGLSPPFGPPLPPIVYLAATLKRHIELASRGSITTYEAGLQAKNFIKGAIAALSHRVKWSSISMFTDGMKLIVKTVEDPTAYDEAAATSGEPVWSAKVPGFQNPPRNTKEEAESVWELYTKHTSRQEPIDDWSDIADIFGAYSANLCEYIDDWHLIWVNLVIRLQAIHDPDSYSIHIPSRSIELLADLWHHLDTLGNPGDHIAQVERLLRQTCGQVPERFDAAWHKLVIYEEEFGQDESLRSFYLDYLRDSQMSDHPTLFLTFLAFNGGDANEDRHLLIDHSFIIERYLSPSIPKILSARFLDVVWHHADRWLDHDDSAIHEIFIKADLPRAIVLRMAHCLLSTPFWGRSDAIQRAKQWLDKLLIRALWIQPILAAFREDTIRMALTQASGESNIEEARLWSELALFISRLGTATFLSNWRSAYGTNFCSVWAFYVYNVPEDALEFLNENISSIQSSKVDTPHIRPSSRLRKTKTTAESFTGGDLAPTPEPYIDARFKLVSQSLTEDKPTLEDLGGKDWYDADSVEAILHLIQGLDDGKGQGEILDTLKIYLAVLEHFGDDKKADADKVGGALSEWKRRCKIKAIKQEFQGKPPTIEPRSKTDPVNAEDLTMASPPKDIEAQRSSERVEREGGSVRHLIPLPRLSWRHSG